MAASSHREVLWRRARSLPVVVALFVVYTVMLPVTLGVALVVDAWRLIRGRPIVATRATLFGWAYLVAENLALLVLLIVWVASGFGRSQRVLLGGAFWAQAKWARFLFGSVRLIFRVGLEVEGLDAVTPGPVIVMMRHATIVDVLLPSVLIQSRAGLKLRYVLKKELLVDPAIDIAGNWLPNHFVARGSRDPSEVTAIRSLSADLGYDEGVLIYPEGTRFTPAKRRRALATLRRTEPELAARAAGFDHVMPPHLGGPMVLLDSITPSDVVFAAHVGLDGFANVKDVWAGVVVGATVRVAFWRCDRAEIPTERAERAAWLFDQWEAVDRWIGDHQSA